MRTLRCGTTLLDHTTQVSQPPFHNHAATSEPRSAPHVVHLVLAASLRSVHAPQVHCAAAAAEKDGAGAASNPSAAWPASKSKAGIGVVEKPPTPCREEAAGMLFPRVGKGMVPTRSGDPGPARSEDAGPPSERRRLELPSSSRPIACLCICSSSTPGGMVKRSQIRAVGGAGGWLEQPRR